MYRDYDIVIVGAGHAGSEAAHACAKLGARTLLTALNLDTIATMPCNPAVGGPAKSHLVKEIDAMGGIMGIASDATYLQLKTLNMSKGPAVRSLRAQSDKKQYSMWVKHHLENIPNLDIYQAMITGLIIEETSLKKRIVGVETSLGEKIYAKAVVITTGTFLSGKVHVGLKSSSAGRQGEFASFGLTETLTSLGFKSRRLKTGTPPRLDGKTINFSILEEHVGDKTPSFFSFLPDRPYRKQYPCFLTRTSEKTHEIILNNLDKSPMYKGIIQGAGPRYCPSIEDKIVRFKDKSSHHLFLEPEGLNTNEIYLQGCSTSLPIEIQWDIVHSLPGLEHALIIRPAYAVEYDYFPGTQFNHGLMSKEIDGLFIAGQVLGTSGYEEAAAQGLVAGINSARYLKNEEPLILERESSYIGTLIDDLVTKEMDEPYRMMTSRSEYRLLLRQDNADQRLTPLGRKLGLVDDFRWKVFNEKMENMHVEKTKLQTTKIQPSNEVNQILETYGEHINEPTILAELLKRPKITYECIKELSALSTQYSALGCEYEIETEIKYEGYINRQLFQISQQNKFEKIKIPSDLNFIEIIHLSKEAREKLTKIRPITIGQASRIGGVSPADITVLLACINGMQKKKDKIVNSV
ncbi:MAG: tRNA uridine-5-carboxymethylaminomethyl(34) synthesis enzyme MnmG [Candidatus Melainabacteria bacterium]|nr:tRNA uridine-5-carboxymethylaminomethyl(34) synthesis enzyme MnmG [Candidatus Melainabacteria bacterium]